MGYHSNANAYASAAVVAVPVDLAAKQREEAQDYLRKEIRVESLKGYKALNSKFCIADDNAPRNGKETVERIAAGLFVINEKMIDTYDAEDEDEYCCSNPLDYLRWRDPAKPADKTGFKAAYEVLEAEEKKVMDALNVLTPEAALDALIGFRQYVASL